MPEGLAGTSRCGLPPQPFTDQFRVLAVELHKLHTADIQRPAFSIRPYHQNERQADGLDSERAAAMARSVLQADHFIRPDAGTISTPQPGGAFEHFGENGDILARTQILGGQSRSDRRCAIRT